MEIAALAIAVLAFINSVMMPLYIARWQRRHSEADRLEETMLAKARRRPVLNPTRRAGTAVDLENIGDDDALNVRIELMPDERGRAVSEDGNGWDVIRAGQSRTARVLFAGSISGKRAEVVYENAAGREFRDKI